MGVICRIAAGAQTHAIASTAYGTCTTGASVAQKVASLKWDYLDALVAGVTVHIHMKYGNTASNITLNVAGTGAKPIRRGGNQPIDLNSDVGTWLADSIVSFTYNGTDWVISGEANNVDMEKVQISQIDTRIDNANVKIDATQNNLNNTNTRLTNVYNELTDTDTTLFSRISNVATKYIEFKNSGMSTETTQLDHGVLVKKYISFTPGTNGHDSHEMPATFIPIGFAIDSVVPLLQNKKPAHVIVGKRSGSTTITAVDLWAYDVTGSVISGTTISGWLWGVQ
jgi:hypothetical protein